MEQVINKFFTSNEKLNKEVKLFLQNNEQERQNYLKTLDILINAYGNMTLQDVSDIIETDILNSFISKE